MDANIKMNQMLILSDKIFKKPSKNASTSNYKFFWTKKNIKKINKEIEVINGPNRNYKTEKSSN